MRERDLNAFLDANGWGQCRRAPLAADASFRRYIRLTNDTGAAMLMDAPPPQEDIRPFVKIDEILRGIGLRAPKIFAADAEHGFLLLEDFGDETFTRVLQHDMTREESLYEMAVDALIQLQQRFVAQTGLLKLDRDRLLTEVQLFTEWCLPAVNPDANTDAARDAFNTAWQAALAITDEMPVSLVLRDYHVDNLMIVRTDGGETVCGLLDFQDASIGSVLYDLASLLKDARRDIGPDLQQTMINRYLNAFPALPKTRFDTHYALLGAQRNVRILGVFTRLAHRDGKPHYLDHMPRLWRMVAADLTHPHMNEVRAWFETFVPETCRVAPNPRPLT